MEHVDTTRTRLVAEMIVSLFGPGPTNAILPGVVVIATAKGEADVNSLLGTKHLFGEKVSLGGLNKEGRREVRPASLCARAKEIRSDLIRISSYRS